MCILKLIHGIIIFVTVFCIINLFFFFSNFAMSKTTTTKCPRFSTTYHTIVKFLEPAI